jgi:hypothetical protein
MESPVSAGASDRLADPISATLTVGVMSTVLGVHLSKATVKGNTCFVHVARTSEAYQMLSAIV